mgnify:CR=1 FL=1
MILKFIFYFCCFLCPLSFIAYLNDMIQNKKQNKIMSNSTMCLFYLSLLSLVYILTYLF